MANEGANLENGDEYETEQVTVPIASWRANKRRWLTLTCIGHVYGEWDHFSRVCPNPHGWSTVTLFDNFTIGYKI